MEHNDHHRISYSGLSFGDLLAVVFIVLKLCGVIDWSWWWVLSPFWIGLIIIIVSILILCALDGK